MESGNLSALSGGLFLATTAIYILLLRWLFVDKLVAAAAAGGTESPSQYSGMYVLAVFVIQLVLAIINLQSGRCKGSSLLDDIYTLGWAMLPWIAVFGLIANVLGTKSFGSVWRRPFSGGMLYDFWGEEATTGVRDFLECCGKGDETSIYKVTSALDLGTYLDTVQEKGFPSNIVSGCPAGASLNPACNKKEINRITEQIARGVAKRDIWANTVWYLMAGSLSSVMYATAIANAKCELSSEQMKELYESNMKAQEESDTVSKDRKVYVSTD